LNYIHQTVDSETLLGIFDLPVSLRNRKVEVIVRPVEAEDSKNHAGASAFGCLRRFANPDKIAGENGAWERAVIEKYAKD
jgi:hypothetical protein